MALPAVLSLCVVAAAQVQISGGGTNCLCPIMKDMSTRHTEEYPDTAVEYSCNGEDEGWAQFARGELDFVATDYYVREEGVECVALAGSPAAFAFRLSNITTLIFDVDLLALVLTGSISTWDDARIKKLNPNASLPSSPIQLLFSRASDTATAVVAFVSASEHWPAMWDMHSLGVWYDTEAEFVDHLQTTEYGFGFAASYQVITRKVSFAVVYTPSGITLPGWTNLASASEYFKRVNGALVRTKDEGYPQGGYPVIGPSYVSFHRNSSKLCSISTFLYDILSKKDGPTYTKHYLMAFSHGVPNTDYGNLHSGECSGPLSEAVNIAVADDSHMATLSAISIEFNHHDATHFVTIAPSEDTLLHLGHEDSAHGNDDTYMPMPIAIRTLDMIVNFELAVASMELDVKHIASVLKKNITFWDDARLSESSSYLPGKRIPVQLVADESLSVHMTAFRRLGLTYEAADAPDVLLPAVQDVAEYVKATPGAVAFVPSVVAAAVGNTGVTPLHDGEHFETAEHMEHEVEELQFTENYKSPVFEEGSEMYPFVDFVYMYVLRDMPDSTGECHKGHVELLEVIVSEEGQELMNHHFGLIAVATFLPITELLKGLKCNGQLYFPESTSSNLAETIKVVAYVLAGVVGLGMLLGVMLWWKRSLLKENVYAAQAIAHALVHFDLVTARVVLLSCKKLPEELREAFFNLIGNLESYRAYLPESCLPGGDGSESEGSLTGTDTRTFDMQTSSVGSKSSATFRRGVHDVRVKKVSVAVVNMVDLHQINSKMVDALEEYAAVISKISQENKAIRDILLGDKMHLSWNGARNVADHMRAATTTALLIAKECEVKKIGVTVGVASGNVRCGAMGADQVKRYTLLGGLVGWTCLLERYNKMFKTKVMGSGRDLRHSVYVRALTQVKYRKMCDEPITLYEICKEKDEHTAEWMYALQDADDKDPFVAWNKAMESYFTGGAASACLHFLRPEALHTPSAQGVISLITKQATVPFTPLTTIDLSDM